MIDATAARDQALERLAAERRELLRKLDAAAELATAATAAYHRGDTDEARRLIGEACSLEFQATEACEALAPLADVIAPEPQP